MNDLRELKILLFFQILICSTQIVNSQQDEFPPLDNSNFISLSYLIYSDQLVIKVDQLPEAMEWSRMIINKTNGDFILGCEVRESGQTFQLVNHSRAYNTSDTFSIQFYNQRRHLDYPIAFISNNYSKERVNGWSKLAIGSDCVVLNCYPRNDPWMPTDYLPTLFGKQLHYLNPKNGRIRSAKWLIYSGYYQQCDIDEWIPIYKELTYRSKTGELARGSALIKNRKISLDEWGLSRD
jgi:hypothetical protein